MAFELLGLQSEAAALQASADAAVIESRPVMQEQCKVGQLVQCKHTVLCSRDCTELNLPMPERNPFGLFGLLCCSAD